ncbi:BTB/POZ domain-containing protein 23 [Elsinoe australis]|uniref:BTB/POZ domain-containing protein 23 n=1 Tax=Elsinoe australis TaxID=40998 RepID=A0A4U7ATA0_9PEZI|nr:BTB/POZ domain-containing protein 23 [Elsinoe australis]
MPTEPVATFQGHARSPSLRLLARISQYELLSRMWSDKAHDSLPPIRARDFAYIDEKPLMILEESRGEISQTRATDFAHLLSGPTVDILVGKEKRRWTLHRNLLLHHSDYFETAFMGTNQPKTKQANQTLELLKEDPAGFELFVKWLYQGRLDDTSTFTDEQKYDYAVACHKLYMLCERFELPDLKNLCVDQYRQCLNEAQLVPDADEINDIYKISPKGSPFRKLMTQIAARQIMDPDTDKDAESYRSCFQDNPDFAVDMVNAIKTGTGGVLFDDPTEGNDCLYHHHENGEACKHRPRIPGLRNTSAERKSSSASPDGRRPTADAQGVVDNVNGERPVRSVRFDDERDESRVDSRRGSASSTDAGSTIKSGVSETKGAGPVVSNGVDGQHSEGGQDEGRPEEHGRGSGGSPSRRKPAKLRRGSPTSSREGTPGE